MVILSIFTSTEFYVTIFVIAASIVVYSAMPRRSVPVRELLSAGKLIDGNPTGTPEINVEVLDSGSIIILRSGLTDYLSITSDAVSLAMKIHGFDIEITERISASGSVRQEKSTVYAMFRIDSLGPGRYHVRYFSPSTQLGTVFTLNIRPGIKVSRVLAR